MDVDVDTPPSFDSTKVFPSWIRAAVVRDGKMTPHPCGVYPQTIPRDPMSGLSAIPYDAAEELGYLKIDFLHLHYLKSIGSREQLEMLVEKEPDWTLLQLQSTHPKLFQLSKHGDLLSKIKPKSVEELSDVMALIRPGKKSLLGLYLKDRVSARKALYVADDTGYAFKKSHALAYSFNVVIQLNLIEQGKL